MKAASKNPSSQYAEIAKIIHGRPAASLARLPAVWQAIVGGGEASAALSDQARADYVEAAQLFRYHDTPFAQESLSAIGHDFDRALYPDFAQLQAETEVARRTIEAVTALFTEFGYEVPASFYQVILAAALREKVGTLMEMFKDKKQLMRDRLQDAVLHAILLVTPVGLRVQSVLSQHGLRFTHVMNCGCNIEVNADAPFTITLDPALKAAYLQNLVAAAFEQYGVNASTSKAV